MREQNHLIRGESRLELSGAGPVPYGRCIGQGMEISELDDDELTAMIEEARPAAADPADHMSQHDLAVLLLESHDRHGDAAAIAEAVGIPRRAVADGGWSGLRALLGSALVHQHELHGDGADLDEAIDLLSAVVRE